MASEPYRGDALMALHELVGGSGSPDVPVLDELFGAFSMWILDLPASESNHHSWAYGLIDHSLEVGLGAILEMEKAWEEEAEASDPESRHGNLWRLTALAVAFMHDCGKVLEVEIKNSKSGELWNPEREPLAFFKCRNQVYMLGGSDFRFRRGRGLKGHEAKGRELASVILPECGSERTRKYFLDGFDAYVAYYDDAPSARPAPLDQIAAFVRHADELSAAASARKGAPPGKYLQKLTKELEALVYP